MDITVFVTTVGDHPNFTECMSRLECQTLKFHLSIIDHVAPLSAAFQQMLDRCSTPFYVQVDEDMLLHPTAIERLYRSIVSTPHNVALVCGPLWDCDMDAPLYGVKIYRHEIVRQFPYNDAMGCERAQMARLRGAGFMIQILPSCGRAECFGEHGKHYSPKSIFARWQRVFQKHRRYGDMKWAEEWPQKLLARYVATRDQLHLFAFLGAVAGIVGPAEDDTEKDWRRGIPHYTEVTRYFPDIQELQNLSPCAGSMGNAISKKT